jgi:hypothetical protein
MIRESAISSAKAASEAREHGAPRDRLGEPQLEAPRVLLARRRAAREQHPGRGEHQRDDDIVEAAFEVPGRTGDILEAEGLEQLRWQHLERRLEIRRALERGPEGDRADDHEDEGDGPPEAGPPGGPERPGDELDRSAHGDHVFPA